MTILIKIEGMEEDVDALLTELEKVLDEKNPSVHVTRLEVEDTPAHIVHNIMYGDYNPSQDET